MDVDDDFLPDLPVETEEKSSLECCGCVLDRSALAADVEENFLLELPDEAEDRSSLQCCGCVLIGSALAVDVDADFLLELPDKTADKSSDRSLLRLVLRSLPRYFSLSLDI